VSGDGRERFERAVRDAYERPVPIGRLDQTALAHALRSERRPRRGVLGLVGGIPRSLAVTPWAAAALTAFLLVAGAALGVALRERARAARDAAVKPEIVQFALVAPTASQVTVVGDFNGWDPAATPMTKVRRGETWMAAIAVPEGRYTYAFVIDGRTWVPDPGAPLAPGDGFGLPSSVLVVQGSRSSS
jgi:hypothetical protein